MPHSSALPRKPAAHAVHTLLQAILDGRLKPGSHLTNERGLAEELGVTRPTLREALQRLAGQGWLTIRHGKPTVVNDIWRDGGLGVLAALAAHRQGIPPDLPEHLLGIRCHLFPPMAAAAARRDPAPIAAWLAEAPPAGAGGARLADYDWALHRCMALGSGNPVFAWILNDFEGLFTLLAPTYFHRAEGAAASRRYYGRLMAALEAGPEAVESEVRRAMGESLDLWRRAGAGL